MVFTYAQKPNTHFCHVLHSVMFSILSCSRVVMPTANKNREHSQFTQNSAPQQEGSAAASAAASARRRRRLPPARGAPSPANICHRAPLSSEYMVATRLEGATATETATSTMAV
jgi:hypothetical protein